MQTLRSLSGVALLSLLMLGAVPALAQQSSSSQGTYRPDRLFLSFIEDATLVENQWWEGQVEFSDGDQIDANIVRGVAAFQPWENWELGGRVGFGSTDAPSEPDGSGATDLDFWAKGLVESVAKHTNLTFGGVLTIPTGDDTAGLGFDAFALDVFAAVRYRMPQLIITGTAGAQLNGDGRFRGSDIDGKIAPSLAGGVIYPFNEEVAVVGELAWDGKRFDGARNSSRLLGGLNWRVGTRGMVRGAISFGLSDGAPDAQIFLGYAYHF
jgi:hypothetical protein